MRMGVVLLLLVFAGECFGVPIEEYQRNPKARWIRDYIQGVGEGFGWANAELRVKGRPLLYCQPGKLSLGPDNYLDILNRELEEPYVAGLRAPTAIEGILLQGLERTFPCP